METQDPILSKYFSSEIREMKRSEIHPATYNPRTIDKEGERNLRQSIKKFSVLGGIIVNSRTGYTVVGGHQKIFILDDLHRYPDNDYLLRVEVIDVDEATEKTINVALNNPGVGGQWDFDMLRELLPDIDYKAAGLSEADLNMIGVDFLHQTEGENAIADELESLMAEATAEHEAAKEERRRQRISAAQTAGEEDEDDDGSDPFGEPEDEDIERQARIDHMREVKEQVRQKAGKTARDMDAYVVISFDRWEDKAEFCRRFGYPDDTRYIKGEVFSEQVERVE